MLKALVGAFSQEKAYGLGAFSVIVKTDCETVDSYAALVVKPQEREDLHVL